MALTEDIGALVIRITANLSGFSDNMNKVDSQIQNTGSKISAFGEAAKTAFGAVGIAAATYLGSAVKAAVSAEKVNADLEQTLKSTGGAAGMTSKELKDLASSLQKTTTFSGSTIKAGEAMLLTFTNIGKDVFPQATATLLDLSQKMGTEPKAAAIQLGKALNDPIKGITALTRVGVTFTEEQKDQIKAMVEAGDVAGAQKIILAELNKEFGGQAAAAANTYEGKMKQLENTMNSAKSTIGTALLPILQKFADAMVKILVPVADFIKENPKFVAVLLSLVGIFGTLVGGMSVFNTLKTILGPLAPMIGIVEKAFGVLSKTILTLITGTLKMLPAALSFILSPAGLVLLAIAAIAAIAFVVIKNWEPISEFFKNLWDGIKSVTQDVANAILDFLKQWGPLILAALTGPIGLAVYAIIKHWDDIKTATTTVWNIIKTAVETVANSIKTIFTNTWRSIETTTKIVWNTISGFLKGIWDGFISWVTNIWPTFKTKFLDVWNGIKAGLKAPINGIIDMVNAVIKALNSIHIKIPDWVPELGGKSFGINIPLIPHLAKGINYFRGGMAIVGELGPELVNLPRGSQVIPNNKIGQPITNHFNIASMIVRNDNDIKAIARELFNLQSVKNRGSGVVYGT